MPPLYVRIVHNGQFQPTNPTSTQIHLVICTYSVPFSPFSVRGGGRKTDPGAFPYILFGFTLYKSSWEG